MVCRQILHSHPPCLNRLATALIEGRGSSIGYRSMHQRLRKCHNLVVSRETVRHALKILDPAGVEACFRHCLQRRRYVCKGPNYIWHIDGYDKLKPFGFCFHGAIDGYTRRILWHDSYEVVDALIYNQ
jgi:hypothetical protein